MIVIVLVSAYNLIVNSAKPIETENYGKPPRADEKT